VGRVAVHQRRYLHLKAFSLRYYEQAGVISVPWYIWTISALGLFIAEIFTPGFLLACFGVASLVTGLFSFLGVGLQGQIVTFSISTLVVFFGLRRVFLKYFDTSIRTNVDALIGKTGRVTERIDPETNRGRVTIGGEDWKGASTGESPIEVGEEVSVIRVEGTKVFVKPLAK